MMMKGHLINFYKNFWKKTDRTQIQVKTCEQFDTFETKRQRLEKKNKQKNKKKDRNI